MSSREIEIELRLTKQLSGSEFERFGNQYLRYSYKGMYPRTKLGSQIGGNNTIPNQPDTFFTLPGHRFKFVELTSQKDGLPSKLKRDLESCLNEGEHGISLERITHIDLFFAGRLKPKQQIEIAAPAQELGIEVAFHGLDQLVNAVVDDARLAKALRLPIDTGQILTVAEFIEQHEGGRLTIGTPLSNNYLERIEYNSLDEKLTSSDIVVIQGQPGCGKTKLALEYLQRYMTERPNGNGFCIIHQPLEIWDDVLSYFPDDKDYLILIDDANRQVENLLILNGSSVFKVLKRRVSFGYLIPQD